MATLKVGIIGCGGRGTSAVLNALQADPHVQLTAMADVFEDHIKHRLDKLQNHPKAIGKIDVPKQRQFVGFNGYQELIASDGDSEPFLR